MSEDRKAIACNYTTGTNIARQGALAYIIPQVGGNLPERVPLIARSRAGRWIQKWEDVRRLGNFRVKTIPPGHPRYDDERIYVEDWRVAKCLERLEWAASEMAG